MRYALRLLDVLSASGIELHLIVSDAAQQVLRAEEGLDLINHSLLDVLPAIDSTRVHLHSSDNMGALPASGSSMTSRTRVRSCGLRDRMPVVISPVGPGFVIGWVVNFPVFLSETVTR